MYTRSLVSLLYFASFFHFIMSILRPAKCKHNGVILRDETMYTVQPSYLSKGPRGGWALAPS